MTARYVKLHYYLVWIDQPRIYEKDMTSNRRNKYHMEILKKLIKARRASHTRILQQWLLPYMQNQTHSPTKVNIKYLPTKNLWIAKCVLCSFSPRKKYFTCGGGRLDTYRITLCIKHVKLSRRRIPISIIHTGLPCVRSYYFSHVFAKF